MQIHVKPINVTKIHVTKCIQRIAGMETSAIFRQDAYTITKRTINKVQRNTVKN